jgi:hypothetical protein
LAYEEKITKLKDEVSVLRASELELKRTNGFQREEIAKLKSDLEGIVYKHHENGASAIEGKNKYLFTASLAAIGE